MQQRENEMSDERRELRRRGEVAGARSSRGRGSEINVSLVNVVLDVVIGGKELGCLGFKYAKTKYANRPGVGVESQPR
ncbi:hypothetical protein Sjap_007457 [Stephania japonica]|uniref:Uncharacterized protein n=1 Tax=Stephania japonica TaxID=461633 RepID=A0AAP0JPC8_9MAGN